MQFLVYAYFAYCVCVMLILVPSSVVCRSSCMKERQASPLIRHTLSARHCFGMGYMTYTPMRVLMVKSWYPPSVLTTIPSPQTARFMGASWIRQDWVGPYIGFIYICVMLSGSVCYTTYRCYDIGGMTTHTCVGKPICCSNVDWLARDLFPMTLYDIIIWDFNQNMKRAFK